MPDLVLVPPLPPDDDSVEDDVGFVRLDSPIGRIEVVTRHFAVERVVVAGTGPLPTIISTNDRTPCCTRQDVNSATTSPVTVDVSICRCG